MKKVLILGAGLVANPMVQYLLSKGYQLTIASNTPERGETMLGGHPNGTNINWSVDDLQTLDQMVMNHDLVVSLLPYVFHVTIAEHALKYKKNMVTTSYVKPEMQALDEDAKKANIIILNEIGLDPGIDHMSAMRIIDNIHAKGGKVKEFWSLCGALPAPECANNPLKYKFSWSPKGVVLAGNNDACYLHKKEIVEIPTQDLFKNPRKLNFPEVGELEFYPNRDSISYIDVYGIKEVETIFRGTFRFKGWCETIDLLKQLKLISNDSFDMTGMTYADLMAKQIGANSSDNIIEKTAAFLNLSKEDTALHSLEWLGLFDNTPMKRAMDTTFEVTSDAMISKMPLGMNERDMIVMRHTFLAEYPDGTSEVIHSSMLDFGSPATDTSIARTVALPAAIAAEMILEGKILLKGVYRPVLPEIYNPVLDQLENMDIKMHEEYGLALSENIQ
ncbi:MAG: saccharopine dehydrogenase C-terminal domain-containing protein [Bacteroidota bacterium]